METKKILENLKSLKRESLIPVLQDIQRVKGYLSKEDLKEVSRYMGIPIAKIYGVASFYNQFKFKPLGKYHIQICRGTACHVKGSAEVMNALLRKLEIESGETTKDNLFSLEVVACVGACSLAPVISVNGEYHAKLTAESVGKLIDVYREKAKGRDDAREN